MYRFLELPAPCRPAAILVTVNAAGNLAEVGRQMVRVRAQTGVVSIEEPAVDSPPYQAHAQSFSRSGARSAEAVVRVR